MDYAFKYWEKHGAEKEEDYKYHATVRKYLIVLHAC